MVVYSFREIPKETYIRLNVCIPRMPRRRRIRGPWGGLTAPVIAEALGESLPSTRKKLRAEKQRLGRYPTMNEIGGIIVKIRTENEIKNIRHFFS